MRIRTYSQYTKLNSNKDFLQPSLSSAIHLTKYFSPLKLGEVKVSNSDIGTFIELFRLEKSFMIIKSLAQHLCAHH